MSCIYKYKGKDYTKDEFYSLVRTTMVQPRTVQKYEKVLFPKGETATKIEGHETIADELRKIEEEISLINKKLNDINNSILYNTDELKENYDNLEQFREDSEVRRINLEKHKTSLEQRKKELKDTGIEKLKPVEAFYEIKVGNILEKQFGKNNVKTITDEYGNQWREIDLTNLGFKVVESIDHLRELSEFGKEKRKECEGNVQAEQGLVIENTSPSKFTKGLEWSVINRPNTDIYAEKGVILKRRVGERNKITSNRWAIIKDFKGGPSHAEGGIDIKVDNGKVSFKRNDSEIEAKCGLVIPKPMKAKEGVVVKPVTRKNRDVEIQKEVVTTEPIVSSGRKSKNLTKVSTIQESKNTRELVKPKLNVKFATNEEIINSKSPVKYKIKQDKLIAKQKALLNLTEKVWKNLEQ